MKTSQYIIVMVGLLWLILFAGTSLLYGETAVIPGDINQICLYTNFFYNYPSEDFFYHLNDRLLFTDKPEGIITGSSLRNKLLSILRWHNVIKKSLQRTKGEKTNIITLNVADEQGYKKAALVLALLGLRIEKTPEGRFSVTRNPAAGPGLADYFQFSFLKTSIIEKQLNKTRRFHFKLKESEIPIPWDYRFLRGVTGVEVDSASFFETLLKNERFSLLLGILYRLSHREIDYISSLEKEPKWNAWKQVYGNKMFLMGLFLLSDALRVTGGENPHWALPGGAAAGPFWSELAGANYKTAPLSFLYSVATKDEGKLNYLYLFSCFLAPETQKALFTGANAAKMPEIYHRLTLTGEEKLKETQFPGLRDFNFYTLLYSLRMEGSRFYFPMGVDAWLKSVSYKDMNLNAFLDSLSFTEMLEGEEDLEPTALDEAVVVLAGGEKVKGTIKSREGSKLVVVATIKEEIEEPKESAKTKIEEPTEVKTQEIVIPQEDDLEIGDEEDYPVQRGFFRKMLGKFWPKRRFFFKVNPTFLQPQDSQYRDIYGDRFFCPELKFGVRITDRISAWYRWGYIAGKAAVPLLQTEASSRQAFTCFGIGYTLKISGRFDWNIDVGLVRISYKEEAMGITVKESAAGFRFDSGFSYHISSRFFTDISASYIYGTSSVLDNPEVKLGGIGAGIGLGVKF